MYTVNKHRKKTVVTHRTAVKSQTDLILVKLMIFKFVFALFLESDDYQGDEDVDEEERKHDEINNIKDCHLHARTWLRSLVLLCRVHRMLQYSERSTQVT